MTQPYKTLSLQSSAITARGLNERRPLNVDSFLADSERGLFSVADGVGGAEAGEVASQTAIEVLDEAFRHQVDGADIEDLMELAIQRANASIYQMAQDHAKFSMMATTIVALHLRGNIATVGHVGDSRLYRLTPEGELIRETEDHSVVEEEVRAGRMTPQQAATHPSKNVISRAIGAEHGVEVDMKTIEVENGTQFLLCTDGITRHIPDYELRHLLIVHEDLASVCNELKQLCYERGAEDNLTAVLVRVGSPVPAERRLEELESTVSPESQLADARESAGQQTNVPLNPEVATSTLVPPSRIAFPAPTDQQRVPLNSDQPLPGIDLPASKGGFGRSLARAFLFLIFLVVVAGAFYAGTRYKGQIPFLPQASQTIPQLSTSPAVAEDSLLKFERARREVDREPNEWLANEMKKELADQGVQNPLESANPEFLYLYGRASLLSGNNEEAATAFEQAITKADANPSPANSTVRKEATLALAAITVKSDKDKPRALTHFDEMLKKPANANSP
jgi:serine/threonine protein phosphatase PrpC